MGVEWLMVRVGRLCGRSGKFTKIPLLGSGDRFFVEFFVFRLCRSALGGVSCPCGSVCGLVEVWCWVAVFFVFLGRNRKNSSRCTGDLKSGLKSGCRQKIAKIAPTCCAAYFNPVCFTI